MKNVLDYLYKLQKNNNREWFQENKKEFQKIQAEFNDFVAGLIDGIAGFDDSVRGLAPKDCVYRIYRDVRFSPNKLPYKNHMSAYIAPGGKNAGNAGYYFHVEPEGGMMIGGNFISAGIYMPEPNILRSIREDITLNGEQFVKMVKNGKDLNLNKEDSLKRVPLGFPIDSPYAEYLKLKNFSLDRSLSNEFVTSPDVLDKTLAEFRQAADFVKWLNKAAQYGREEF